MTVPTIDSLRQSILEATAWMEARETSDCRSAALRPDDDFIESGNVETGKLGQDLRVAAARRTASVQDLVSRRKQLVQEQPVLVATRPRWDDVASRMLLYFPYLSMMDGTSQRASGGIFDFHDVPGWDTWVGYIDRVADWETHAEKPRTDLSVNMLLAYVPPRLVAPVDKGISENLTGAIEWAKSYCDNNPACSFAAMYSELRSP